MFLTLFISIVFLAELSMQTELSGMLFTQRCIEPHVAYGVRMPPYPRCPPTPKKESVPLTSVSVHATVRAWAYDVTAELNYVNKLGQTIECQYVFPISDKAAVYKMEATIAGRTLKAEIRNRTEAEDIYRTAVDSGQKAALLVSQDGSPDVYRIMLGNLPPNGMAVVKIGYAQQVERDPETGTLSINLPVVLNPRYVPRSDLENNLDNLKGNYFPNVPYVAVSEVHYTMTFSANIDMGVGGGQIDSIQAGNTTDILDTTVAQNKRTATVKLTSPFSQDHDFRLFINVTQGSAQQPAVSVEPGVPQSDDAGATKWLSYDIAAAWFEPIGKQVTSGTTSNDEYWLVIDRSGSMSGDKIENAKTALALFVKSLPVGCKFNIVGFGSTYAALFPSSNEYSETSATTAVNYANTLQADFGGTEILQPLQYIYAQPAPQNGVRRFIILLTDGEVSNTNDVINIARQNAATTRVYSVGIGEGASTALVNGVARVSNGLSEFVRSSSDRLQAKVISLLKATTLPSAENVKLSWPITSGGKLVMVAPNSSIPSSALSGHAIAQYAIIQRQGSGNVVGSSDFSAKVGNNPVTYKAPFAISGEVFSDVDDPLPLHRLGAKAYLVDLVDSYYSSRNNDIKKKAVELSITTGVLCEFTAIVAVDSNTGGTASDSSGKPLLVNIERPTVYDMNTMFGGGGGLSSMIFSSFARMPAAVPSYSMMGARSPGGPMGSLGSAGGNMQVRPYMQTPPAAYRPAPAQEAQPYKKNPTVPGASDMDALIQLQKFAGSWPMSDAFASAVGAPGISTVTSLSATARAAITPRVDDETLATLVGVAVLRRRFANRRTEWEFIEGKALTFLRQPARNIGSASIDSLVTAVGTALKL